MTTVVTDNDELINSSRYYFQVINITILAVRMGKPKQRGEVVG